LETIFPKPARREVPDNGLREFLIYELHTFGAVLCLLIGKSRVVQRGRRCRKTPASRQCVGSVADAVLTINSWRRSGRWISHDNTQTLSIHTESV
jgi:hypothetical protein